VTRYIDAKTTAIMLRSALKATFPGVKFSVRKGNGTGAAWLSVSWVDGPTNTAVQAITERYKGSNWNLNNNDSRTNNSNALVVFDDAEFPEEVHFSCAGINTHREMSDDAEAMMTAHLSSALNGLEYRRENMEGLVVNGTILRKIYDVRTALWQVFSGIDLSNVSV
jgi:hypothetical protein